MLSHLAVFSVQGPEAGPFLQGQLTQDVLSMRASEARAGGYCSAKGRLLGTFIIVHPEPNAWWFITHAAVAPALVKRLKMFVLRAKCTVTERGELGVSGSSNSAWAPWQVHIDAAPASAADTPDARPAAQRAQVGWFGGRALRIAPLDEGAATGHEASSGGQAEQGSQAEQSAQGSPGAKDAMTEAAWRHADIQAGWPWIEPATVEQFVPQMINFEVLGGVNFRKGCYPGQEVVARSQYRGTLKRRMAIYRVQADAPPAGTEIFDPQDPDQPAGQVVNAAADPARPAEAVLLAEVKLHAQAASGPLRLGTVEGPALQALTLPYRIPTESEM